MSLNIDMNAVSLAGTELDTCSSNIATAGLSLNSAATCSTGTTAAAESVLIGPLAAQIASAYSTVLADIMLSLEGLSDALRSVSNGYQADKTQADATMRQLKDGTFTNGYGRFE